MRASLSVSAVLATLAFAFIAVTVAPAEGATKMPLDICTCVSCVAGKRGAPNTFNVYINGEWKPSASGKTQKVIAPFNE